MQFVDEFRDPLGEIAILKAKAREAKKTPQAFIVGYIRDRVRGLPFKEAVCSEKSRNSLPSS